MGEVVELARAQRARAERRRTLAEQAFMHPALRWLTRENRSWAHRRRPGGTTACGLVGPLVIADTSVDFCPICYPYWASVIA